MEETVDGAGGNVCVEETVMVLCGRDIGWYWRQYLCGRDSGW